MQKIPSSSSLKEDLNNSFDKKELMKLKLEFSSKHDNKKIGL